MGLEIHDVAHSFGDRLALDGVSFDVAPGVITGLLGPNGAGKTTLLRIMLGVLSPDRGEVHYNGRPGASRTADDGATCRRNAASTPVCRPVTRSPTSGGCTGCPVGTR